MKKNLLSAALLVGFLTGCASNQVGNKIESTDVSQIKKGVTTRAEVEARFGAPMQVTMAGDGKRTLFYQYSSSEAHASPSALLYLIPVYGGLYNGGAKGQSRMQQLQIVVNNSNIVEDYEFNDGATAHESGGFLGTKMTSTPIAPSP